MSFFDIIIVGTGPTALGFLSNFPKNLKVGIISHRLTSNYILDSNKDYAYINSFGGGLNSWHGASSSELAKKLNYPKKNIHNFFCKSYDEDAYISDDFINSNVVYVPRKKIDLSFFMAQIERINCNIIVDNVLSIKKIKNTIAVKCQFSSHIASRVILCAGAIGTANILKNSNYASMNKYIGNHICGYAQIQSKAYQLKIKSLKNGFLNPYSTGKFSKLNFSQFSRPCYFDFKYKEIISKYKTTYSKDKKSIYNSIIKSFSPGLAMEALYNRYGFYIGSPPVNTYFQLETKNIYFINKNNILVDKKNLSNLLKNLSRKDDFKDADISNVVSGIHYFNTVSAIDSSITTVDNFMNKSRKDDLIIIGDSSTLDSIGGTHHTFSIMAANNFIAQYLYG